MEAMDQRNFLEIREVKKAYGGNPAVRGVSLDVAEQELVALLGPSGCGKTTLLRCIAGLETIDGGEIRLGETILSSPEKKIFVRPEKRGFGMVFQSYALWPHMTVLQNVVYPLRVKGAKRVSAEEAGRKVLELVELAGFENRAVGKLSGGQQQRVALARAIIGKPAVMLFDEPLSNLDAALRESLRDYILSAHQAAGGLSVYVTHDQSEAFYLADRVAVMFEGRIFQVGKPDEVYKSPADPRVAAFVGFDNFLDGVLVSADDDGYGEVRLVSRTEQKLRVRLNKESKPATGDRVTVAVRSSSFRLRPLPDDAQSTWTGKVVDARHLQSLTEYRVETGVTFVKVRIPEGAHNGQLPIGAHVGDKVELDVDADLAIAFPAADESQGGTPM